jgi:hypothetical protein
MLQETSTSEKNSDLYNTFLLFSPYVLSSRSHRIPRRELLQAQPRRIDGTRPCIYEDVVKEATKRTAKEGRYHWDLHELADVIDIVGRRTQK